MNPTIAITRILQGELMNPRQQGRILGWTLRLIAIARSAKAEYLTCPSFADFKLDLKRIDRLAAA